MNFYWQNWTFIRFFVDLSLAPWNTPWLQCQPILPSLSLVLSCSFSSQLREGFMTRPDTNTTTNGKQNYNTDGKTGKQSGAYIQLSERLDTDWTLRDWNVSKHHTALWYRGVSVGASSIWHTLIPTGVSLSDSQCTFFQSETDL